MGRASRQKRDKHLPAAEPIVSDTVVDDETLRRKEMDDALDIIRKESDERMVKRINLYKAFADLVKMSPTATALAVTAALLTTGIYKPFDAPWVNHAAGIALRTVAFAGAFASWVVFNDALTRFFARRDSRKWPFIGFGLLVVSFVVGIPSFAFDYAVTHHHWLGQ